MAGVRFNTDPRSTVHHSRASGNPVKQFVATATPLIREVETTIRDNPDINKVWLNSHIYAILISCWKAILSGMRPSAIGERVRKSMSRQIQYTDEPIGHFRQVVDFLPSPEELKLKSETTKITISLSTESLAYFKEVARANHSQYQKMIRQLLDDYVAHQKSAGE